jgi:hypothetical protein
MTDTAQNQAFYAAPTLSDRLWRAMGFVYHLGEEPEGADALPGWMKTDMHIHFGWADRLRLLLSGKLFIASIVQTDTPSAMVCKSRMDWRIKTPGERHARD